MPLEIERKFLVKGDAWRDGDPGVLYRQGYLSAHKERVVRIRVMGENGRLTVKGVNVGMTRLEYEYDIPVADARHMLEELCETPRIRKTRYFRTHAGLEWVIDEFHDENAGLIVAEIELEHQEQQVDLPAWVAAEITHDPRYFNSNLIANPYCRW